MTFANVERRMLYGHIFRPSSSALLIAGLLAGSLMGFGIGTRFAGTSTETAAIPTSSVLDVQPAAVSQRLRDAYYAAGGAIQVCVAAASVHCTRSIAVQSERPYNDTSTPLNPDDVAQLKPAHVAPGRIILAGAFGPVDGATISGIQPTGSMDGRPVVIANPDGQGIDYADLGDLEPGTYLVALYVPSLLPRSTMLLEIVVE